MAIRLGFQDTEMEIEGKVYESGGEVIRLVQPFI